MTKLNRAAMIKKIETIEVGKLIEFTTTDDMLRAHGCGVWEVVGFTKITSAGWIMTIRRPGQPAMESLPNPLYGDPRFPNAPAVDHRWNNINVELKPFTRCMGWELVG